MMTLGRPHFLAGSKTDARRLSYQQLLITQRGMNDGSFDALLAASR
jgi:hypothetical protein